MKREHWKLFRVNGIPEKQKNTKKFANCNRGDVSLHDHSGWHRKLSEWIRWLECALRNTRFGAWKFAYFFPNRAESKKRVVRVQWRVNVPVKKHAPVAQIIVIKGAGSATCACTHARTQVKSFIHKKEHPSNHQLDNPIQRESAAHRLTQVSAKETPRWLHRTR